MKRTACMSIAVWTVALFCTPVGARATSSEPGEIATANLAILQKTNSCEGCDLRGVNLQRGELAGADLEGADLSGARMHLANLAGANLKNANLQGVSFGGADLAGADLRGADLSNSSLDGAYTVGTLFDDGAVGVVSSESGETEPGATVDTVVSESAEVSGQDMQETGNSSAARTVQPAMTAMNAEPGVASAVENEPAVVADNKAPGLAEESAQPLPESSEPPVEHSPVADSVSEVTVADDAGEATPDTVENTPVAETVAGQSAAAMAEPEIATETPPEANGKVALKPEPVSVEDAKLVAREHLLKTKKCYGCDLSGIDLSGANLKGGDLEKAVLAGCNLSGAVLRKANLKGADLSGADLRNADLREADLYEADLSGSDLTGADVKGAVFEDTRLTDVVGLVQESVLVVPEEK